MEGLLRQEEDPFFILKFGGYGITTAASKSLTADRSWLPQDATVFFRPGADADPKAKTPITNDLRILVLRVEFISPAADTPKVIMCCLHHIQPKRELKNFEDYLATFSYGGNKVFARRAERVVDYEDSYSILKGQLIEHDLFAIRDSDAVVNMLVKPILEVYRSHRYSPGESGSMPSRPRPTSDH